MNTVRFPSPDHPPSPVIPLAASFRVLGAASSAASAAAGLPAGPRASLPPTIPDLTPAEERVLPYLLAGWSNKEIARELNRATGTIKHQVAACLRKFGQPSRARLIAALR